MDGKICTECGERKPLTAFHKRAAMKDGHKSACKECSCKRTADRYATNPEAERERSRQNYRADLTASRQRGRANQRQRRQNKPEEVKEYARQQRVKHAERVRAQSVQDKANRRAVKLGATFERVSYRLLRTVFQDCYLCGQSLSGRVHYDHVVPLARGGAHSTQNLRPTHERCNLRKGDRMLCELTWYSGSVLLGAWVLAARD